MSESDDQVERPAPPKPVQVSFWLWIVAAVVLVAGYIVLLLARQPLVDELARANPQLPHDTVVSRITGLLVWLLVGATSFAAFFVLFAWKARQGTRSARTVLTVLIGVVLLFQLLLRTYTGISLIATLIGLIALALMYIPPVQGYFPKAGRRQS